MLEVDSISRDIIKLEKHKDVRGMQRAPRAQDNGDGSGGSSPVEALIAMGYKKSLALEVCQL